MQSTQVPDAGGPAIIDSVKALEAIAGIEVASGWTTVDQRMIDAFAEVTGDHQWIHVDTARAADSPFAGTIAHGMLTMSLIPKFLGETFHFLNRKSSLNYGFDRVRFVAPVRVDSQLRGAFTVRSVQRLPSHDHRVGVDIRVDIKNEPKPALAAHWLIQMRY